SPTFPSQLIITCQAFPDACTEWVNRYPDLWHTLTLRGLSGTAQNDEPSEQVQFFVKAGIPVSESDAALVNKIGRIYEGHPLVLEVMAGEIRQQYGGNVVRYWERHHQEFEQIARELQAQRLEETDYNEALDRQVRERLKRSLEQLPPDVLNLLCRSSVYRRPVPKQFWLPMIGDLPSKQQNAAYRILGHRALIEPADSSPEQPLIRQHNLIGDIAYNLLREDPPTWESAERKAAELWLTAYKPASNSSKLERIRGYLEAFHHYWEIQDWEKAQEIISRRVDRFLGVPIPDGWVSPIDIQRSVLGGVDLCKELHDQLGIWGYYEEQISLYKKQSKRPDIQTRLTCLNCLGHAYSSISNYSSAKHSFKEVLNLSKNAGNISHEKSALHGLHNVYYFQGDYPSAINYGEVWLEKAQQTDDLVSVGQALGSLGNIHTSLGQYEQALEYYARWKDIAQETGDLDGEMTAIGNIAVLYRYLGDYQTALEYNQEQLALAQYLGSRAEEGRALNNLGAICFALGYDKKSIEYAEQYLNFSREDGDLRGEAVTLANLGRSLLQLKEYAKAQARLESALNICRTIGIPVEEAPILATLALLYWLSGQIELAKDLCQQALALATELGIPLAAECEALQLTIENEKLKVENGVENPSFHQETDPE
ncbi:MAG TPA: hypothetical protein DD379_27930, partial [Cyanobacteria bacterium UBA11162]|nr:hypothetical protein [Cyanobacteria bacterium UBA11162]